MKKIAIVLLLPVLLSGCLSGSGVGKTVKFKKPDIKDEFCGVHINFQYCKCAFHNEYCDAVGMNKSSANSYVQAEYERWLAEQLLAFGADCAIQGGIYDGGDDCKYCQEDFVIKDNKCVPPNEADEADSAEFVADGPLTSNCQIKPDEFDRDWKKYSDIDNAIPFEERSFEAKQAVTSYDAMIELMVEGFELERDFEVEGQMQTELANYRAALVQNIKTNLLKAFWRLSWVTYSTIKGGKDLGKSYESLLNTAEGVEAIGTGLKLVQGVIPGDSQLAIDTSSVKGKAVSVGANVALEAVESLGDPTKIATELFKSAANAPLPSADISQEEIDILKNQHITKGVIDEILAESQAANDVRQARMNEIEADIAQLQKEIADFEAREKERVKISLEESCRTLKEQFEREN